MSDFSLKMHQIQFRLGCAHSAPSDPLAGFGEKGREGERKREGKVKGEWGRDRGRGGRERVREEGEVLEEEGNLLHEPDILNKGLLTFSLTYLLTYLLT